MTTIYDVATAAGVSRQTVSNVLNSPEVVRPATRERVLAVINQLGYRPHASARRLRTRTSSTLAIRIAPSGDGISGSILDTLLHSVTVHARTRGLRVLLFSAADPYDEIEQFQDLLAGSDVDAFIITGTTHEDPRLEWLLGRHVPFVSFGRPWGLPAEESQAISWVDVDGYSGIREATRSLLSSGHHEIGFLGWPSPSGTGDERRRGWRDTMTEEAGWTRADVTTLQRATTEGISGAKEAAIGLQQAHPGLDAIVCASDTLALGAILADIDVPVIGFDSTPVSVSLGFPSVAQPIDEVAHAIIEIIVRLVERGDDDPLPPEEFRQRLLLPHLIQHGQAPS